VSGVLRELSLCLCKWNRQLDRVVASFFVKASGCLFQRSLSVHPQRVVMRLAGVVYSRLV
jgi:hypothetical protein